MLRSIFSELRSIKVNWCLLFCLDAPPLKIACMSDSYIATKIRRVKSDPRYTEVLQLQRLLLPEPEELEMDSAPTSTNPQASTSQESSSLAPQLSNPTPEEEAIDNAGQKVLSATYTSSV